MHSELKGSLYKDVRILEKGGIPREIIYGLPTQNNNGVWDWKRLELGFQRFDSGNLNEEDNSINAVPMWTSTGGINKSPTAIMLADDEAYGMQYFYVSSYPQEEHWAVHMDYSLTDINLQRNPKIELCAINLVKGSTKKFEDYYSVVGLCTTSPESPDRFVNITLRPKQATLDTNAQYRSITSIHNIRNSKDSVSNRFAKTVFAINDSGINPPTGTTMTVNAVIHTLSDSAGLPQGGNVGDVLLKTGDGSGWSNSLSSEIESLTANLRLAESAIANLTSQIAGLGGSGAVFTVNRNSVSIPTGASSWEGAQFTIPQITASELTNAGITSLSGRTVVVTVQSSNAVSGGVLLIRTITPNASNNTVSLTGFGQWLTSMSAVNMVLQIVVV